MNWPEFLAMGGYAMYVWPAWVLTVLIFAWHILQPVLLKRQLQRRAAQQKAREQIENSARA